MRTDSLQCIFDKKMPVVAISDFVEVSSGEQRACARERSLGRDVVRLAADVEDSSSLRSVVSARQAMSLRHEPLRICYFHLISSKFLAARSLDRILYRGRDV